MEGVKLTRLAASAAMVVVGLLLALYGLLALTFKEGDGPTYVTMGAIGSMPTSSAAWG
jgi:hypothetical protein